MYTVILDDLYVSVEYEGNDFREAVQVYSDWYEFDKTAPLLFIYNGKEIELIRK